MAVILNLIIPHENPLEMQEAETDRDVEEIAAHEAGVSSREKEKHAL